jgi:hypothetical protein
MTLSMLAGPAVAVPVPQGVVEALTSVRVMTASGQRGGFQLTFELSKDSPLHTVFLLAGGALPPIFRVVLVAVVNGSSQVLADGVVVHCSVTPGDGTNPARLTVVGADLSAVMDLIPLDGLPYPAMPPEARVLVCLAKYAFLGVVPLIVPSVLLDIPIPVERIPRHQGTDYAYVTQLADDVGYSFWVEPGVVPGQSTAYWGPEIKVGAPQPALNVDMDAYTNVESMELTYDSENATLPIVTIHNPQTKIPIPIPVPPITPLNPPLGALPPIPKKLDWISGSAKLSPIQAALVGIAKAAKTADVVGANGTLDVFRYGRPLKARRLVGLRGAGPAYDGLWYVSSVTDEIKRGEWKQSFRLVRNGLLSTVARVPA